ncbi:MAG: hypothetical protein AABO41_18680 [Acidobacteriota bacterium]
MSVIATVTLDSGCFLTRKKDAVEPYSAEVGYFESEKGTSDIKVQIDGQQVTSPELENLGKKCVIEVRRKDNGDIHRKDGARSSPTFHDRLLHMTDLYNDPQMDSAEDNFDCILRFESGYFYAAKVKDRTFKEHKKQADSSLTYSDGNGKQVVQSIAHDVAIYFRLEDGEALELVRNNEKPFWSSKDSGAKTSIDITFVADKSTVEKFYCHALKDARSSYWLPNQPEDPPPTCSKPPCNGDPGNP